MTCLVRFTLGVLLPSNNCEVEGATWQVEDLEVGVYPLLPNSRPWDVNPATKVKAKRTGFFLVPNFGATAHML